MKQTAQSGAIAAQNEKQTEVAKTEKPKNVKDLLEARMGEIQKVLPSVITPQQFLRLALNALQNTPHLMECTMQSFYGAIMQCAQLGLKPNVNGEAYLIPFFNGKKKAYECQFLTGYKGLMLLARRSGEIASIDAQTVYENDTFDLSWSFRYRAQSRSLGYNRADGETGKLDIIRVNDNMTNADGGTYSGFESTGKTLSADGYESSYNDGYSFDNFPTNALIFNTVLDNASIFVIHSSSPVYVLQILDGQTLVNRLRFKAAKELNDSGIDFTLYANFEQYAAADANAASYLESNYGHIDGSYFFMKYDYDILYDLNPITAQTSDVSPIITRDNTHGSDYAGDQIILSDKGAGLYALYSTGDSPDYAYVAVTGVAGEESADQPGIANAAVSGIDFIYDGVIITQEAVVQGATAIDAFSFVTQTGSIFENYIATATLVYITGNSSAAVILGFVRSTDGGPLNVGYKIEGQNDLVPSQTSSSAQITADGDIGVTVSASGAVVTGWPNSTATG